MSREDAVIKQVRRARDEYASGFGYDLDRIVADLKEKEQRRRHQLVRLRPRSCRHPARSRGPHAAFTLVELLVVVSIIVVLISLLSPALDVAIYQAELASCGARQKATCEGLSIYALDFKRAYPYRLVVENGQDASVYPWQLNVGAQGAGAVATGNDDRDALKGYVNLKLLVDPLCKQVRLDHPDDWAYTSYALWSGWHFKGQPGMTKVGKGLTWVDTGATPPTTYTANWLITDLDCVDVGAAIYQGSHPDDPSVGLLRNYAVEHGGKDINDPVVQANNKTATESGSFWASWFTGWKRGDIEMNAAAEDGSVQRYNRVRVGQDDRMARAPITPGATASTTNTWMSVPLR